MSTSDGLHLQLVTINSEESLLIPTEWLPAFKNFEQFDFFCECLWRMEMYYRLSADDEHEFYHRHFHYIYELEGKDFGEFQRMVIVSVEDDGDHRLAVMSRWRSLDTPRLNGKALEEFVKRLIAFTAKRYCSSG